MSHQSVKGFEILNPSLYQAGRTLSIREPPPDSADGKPPPPLPRRLRSLLLACEEHINFVERFFLLITAASFTPLTRKEEFVESFVGGWTDELLQELQQLSQNVDACEPSQPELQSFPLAFMTKFVSFVVDKAVLAGFKKPNEADKCLKPFLQKWEKSGKSAGTSSISDLNTVEKRRRSSRKLFQYDGWYTENDIEAIKQQFGSKPATYRLHNHAIYKLLDPNNLTPMLLWPMLWPLCDTFELYPVVGGTERQKRLRELHQNATAEIQAMKPTADNPTGKNEDHPEGRNYVDCAIFTTEAIEYLRSEVLAGQWPFNLFGSTIDMKRGDPSLLNLIGQDMEYLPDDLDLPGLALSYSSGPVEVKVSKLT
ncbi:hypothetical protein IF1G_11090 [Cordyceps javanica]|uniref:Uncharacterized protein n=1 Tax=Cordyceps javanica TaxID=43265 RepID=A0A545ULC6_9HYPO|nr:hypothetical protein IF1G_11090 [Cordyceps javanica]